MIRTVILAVVFALTAACSALPTGLPPRSTIEPPSSSALPSSPAAAPSARPDVSTAVNGPPAPTPHPGAPAPAVVACPTGWGTGTKTSPAMGTAPITGIRAGRHACFDRLVFDLDGSAAGFTASYVDQVTADGSGNPVTVPGGARIQLVIRHPQTASPAPGTSVANVAGFPTLRAVVAAGSFEGVTTFGVGVVEKRPMRVFILQHPGRIVLDVAS